MSILSRLEAKRTQVVILREWIEARPKKERDEWLEAFRRADLYSSSSILSLLEEEGLSGINENTVVRFRRKLEGYVSAR